MEPIKLRFTLTQSDYAKAIRAFDLRSSRTYLIYGMLGLAIILLSISLVGSILLAGGLDHPRIPLTVGGLIFAALFIIYRLFLMPVLLARRFSKEVLQKSEFNYEIADDYFHAKSLHGESKVMWDFFDRAIETKEFYLLTQKLNNRQFTFIPKRAFESPEHEKAFRQLVETHLGKIKN